jgi:hypothetical protein
MSDEMKIQILADALRLFASSNYWDLANGEYLWDYGMPNTTGSWQPISPIEIAMDALKKAEVMP